MSTYIERAEMWESKARDHLHAAFHQMGAGKPGVASKEARAAADALLRADGERYYAREAEKARAARATDKEQNGDG